MSRFLYLLPLALLGCDNLIEPRPADGVSLTLVESSYQHGEIAEAQLVNGSDESIGYNLCLAMWELRVGDGWERIVPLRMCEQAVYVLHPGAEARLRESVDEGWRPGTYRFVLDVKLMGQDGRSATVVSEAFDVHDRTAGARR